MILTKNRLMKKSIKEETVVSHTLLFKAMLGSLTYMICTILRIKGRVRSLYSHPVLIFVPFSHIFLCRFGDCHTVISAFFRRYYDVYSPIEGMIIIDVGAHIGTFTVKCAKKLQKLRRFIIISIEPEPDNYRLLRINISLNKLKNVLPIFAALGRYSGKARLYLHGFTGHSLVHTSDKYILVPVYSLDDLCEKLRISKVDLIKVNIEGSELEFLKGSERTLKRTRALVIAAHHEPNEANVISDFLKSRNFHTRIVFVKGNILVLAQSRSGLKNL